MFGCRLTALPALLPGWGEVTPFVLQNTSQFGIPPPPALDSERYAQDYNEIKVIGAINSPTRTVEQTQIATFWLGSPVAIWNQPLSQLIAASDFDISTTARTFGSSIWRRLTPALSAGRISTNTISGGRSLLFCAAAKTETT